MRIIRFKVNRNSLRMKNVKLTVIHSINILAKVVTSNVNYEKDVDMYKWIRQVIR